MSANRARLRLSSVVVAMACAALAAACGPSDAEIKKAADSLSASPKDTGAAGAAGTTAGDTSAARRAADSAARDSAARAGAPAKRP